MQRVHNKSLIKRVVAIILMASITLSSSMIAFAGSATLPTQINVFDNKIIQQSLALKGIQTELVNGRIVLVNPSANNITLANKILQTNSFETQSRSLSKASTKYPTSWVPMNNGDFDIYDSKNVKRASKTALISTIGTWLSGINAYSTLAKVFVGVFFADMFLNSETEKIKYSARYEYRELGPGKFDSNGNFLGNYEIRKTEKIYLDKDSSKYTSQVTTKKSTNLDIWF